jgi:hypothetical protein
MTVDQVFASFVEKEGTHMLHDHMIQLWWRVQLGSEEGILELIDDLSAEYDDPTAAEIGFIALWGHLAQA